MRNSDFMYEVHFWFPEGKTFMMKMHQIPHKDDYVYLTDISKEEFHSDYMKWEEFDALKSQNAYWVVARVSWSLGMFASVTIALVEDKEQSKQPVK